MKEQELKIIPVEEQITVELVKANVTETIINSLKERYLPLKIDGIDDKETYLQVKEARKECKSLRVLAEKICKKGREEAVAIQKAWVSKEKEVTGQISKVEDYLEKQEKDYETAVEAEKQRRKREQEEQFILRQQSLSSMGVLYDNGNFTIGEVSFEMSIIKECDPEIWENDIKPKYEEEFKKVEAVRLEQERVKQEKEAELKKQQEEMERRERELAEKEAALKAAQEEQEKKKQEEEERKSNEEKQKRQELQSKRLNELLPYNKYGSEVDMTILWDLSEDKYQDILSKKKREHEIEIDKQKEHERIKVLGKSRMEILKQYNAGTDANIDAVGKWDEIEWEIIRSGWQDAYEKEQHQKWEKEQEERKKEEELKRQQQIEQSKDKEKWEAIMEKVNAIEVYDMRSSQYRKKAMILREKLEEIKAL